MEDDQLERSGYIMEMECRQQWMSVSKAVDTTESIVGKYESQTRSLLVQEIGSGEVCSICTAMFTNEMIAHPPTQISTSGWDKGTASSTFAFCNGLDTAARKLLCSASVPYLMELAHEETDGDMVKHLSPNWQLQDSIRGLLDTSPLFTQYRYSVEKK